MSRQRFAFTLPQQCEPPFPQDLEELNDHSNVYAIQDSLWPEFLAPEPEPLIPLWLYQYPLYPASSEIFQNVPTFFPPTVSIENYESFLEDVPRDPLGLLNDNGDDDNEYGDSYLLSDVPLDENRNVYENLQAFPEDMPYSYPMITNYGAVTILLRHLVRVDISAEQAVYVSNPPGNSVAAISGTGDRSCIIHPNGRILQHGSDIHMATLSRKAKMCKRGIVFTSVDHCLSYLVDASGTKTTSEKFQDLHNDISIAVFYSDSLHDNYLEECCKMVTKSVHKTFRNGDKVWTVGAFRIKQDHFGDVKVTHTFERRVVRASPTNGQMSVKSSDVEMSVGRYPNNYFDVRKGRQHVKASLRGFRVQNGTQKAGFNSSGRVVLY
ncbi:uncharacterized protein LOC129224245 [Uloborus diversus]|uniref:uncharacterized protein LOC129224245 n=1 Tax=Uloborus diversus TaxID=327109 RepID=UPI0024098E09|nr:uncharacterized protein LOC129224245 [Uloborus diversus]